MRQDESNEALPAEQRTTAKTILVVEDDKDIRLTAFEKPFDLEVFYLTMQRMIGEARSSKRAEEGRSY